MGNYSEKRLPNEVEARGFKTAVLEAAAKWLREKPVLDRDAFQVRINVEHISHATEDLDEYFQRDTGDEAK